MPLIVAGKQMSNGALAVAGGLVVGIVDTFLPWQPTTIPTVFGADSGGHDALRYWSGWLFLLVLLVGVAFFVMRTFVPRVAIPALPVADWMIYAGIAVIALLSALLWLATGGGSSNFDATYQGLPVYGVFIGICAAAAVAAGAYLMKTEPQPATKPLSAYQSPSASSPPPPAAPSVPAPPAPTVPSA